MDELNHFIEQLQEKGPRQFAAWNEDAFTAWWNVPIKQLLAYLEFQDRERERDALDIDSIKNFAQLVYEGVGAGWLRPISDQAPASTFLAYCMWSLVPCKLGDAPPQDRASLLQMVWNIGEGMAGEPQWLNQFAITRTDWSTDLAELSQHLEQTMAPALSPMPSASWSGDLALQVFKLREISDAFVPGRLYLAAPAILCIEHRTPTAETIAILLQKNQQSEVLGLVGKLPEYTDPFDAPIIDVGPHSISIDRRSIDAPFIASPSQRIVVASGFVAVCTSDSQNLWLVESQ